MLDHSVGTSAEWCNKYFPTRKSEQQFCQLLASHSHRRTPQIFRVAQYNVILPATKLEQKQSQVSYSATPPVADMYLLPVFQHLLPLTVRSL